MLDLAGLKESLIVGKVPSIRVYLYIRVSPRHSVSTSDYLWITRISTSDYLCITRISTSDYLCTTRISTSGYLCITRISTSGYHCITHISTSVYLCITRISTPGYHCITRISTPEYLCITRISTSGYHCITRISTSGYWRHNVGCLGLSPSGVDFSYLMPSQTMLFAFLCPLSNRISITQPEVVGTKTTHNISPINFVWQSLFSFFLCILCLCLPV